MARSALLASVGAVWLVAASSAPARAVTCNVPSASHPTLGAVLRDGSCTTAELAAGSHAGNVTLNRDLAVAGAGSSSTSLAGYLAVAGAGTEVTLAALSIDGTAAGVAGCWSEILAAYGGGKVTAGPDLRVLQTAAGGTDCRLFADDFESGGVLAWSAHAP